MKHNVGGLLLAVRTVFLSTFVILTACSSNDENGGDSVVDDQVLCPDPTGLPEATFTVSRPFINTGESTVLQWESLEASAVTIEPIGVVETSGEQSVSPAQTTTYRLVAELGNDCNVITQTVDVREAAAVSIQANTLEGVAPLSVRFSPIVDSRTAINRYYWDFEGDGGPVDGGLGIEEQGFDLLNLPLIGNREFDVVGRDIVFEFTTPGTYTTRVRVWDLNENQADATLSVTVENAPPQAVVRASPTTGTVPLLSTLEVVSATDNEGIVSVEWDFEGDGIYDETESFGEPQTTIRASTDHLYDRVGAFEPIVRITDTLGASTELNPLNLQVNAVLQDVPAVSVTARPNEGLAPLSVSFSSSVRNITGTPQYAWDFDGDGVIDNTTDTRPLVEFDRVGTFYPTLSVTSEDGSIGRDIVSVSVTANHQLAITNSAINPERDETTDIALSVNGSSPLQFVIEDAGGAVTKTFIDWVDTTSGEYSFTWDGRNDSGEIPAPGDYYAVIRYRTNDEREETIDLRTTTGGLIFYPNDSSVGNTCDRGVDCGTLTISGVDISTGVNAIQPFGETPVNFAFDLPQNGKVSAYVTVRGSENFSPATFFRSRNLAQGDYSVNWFADGTDGKLLPSRTRNRGYVPAIFGLSASDNAIFLSHDTKIENFTVSPSIFYPSISSNGLTNAMTFDLTRQADILMRVDSLDAGTEVYRRTFADVSAGTNVTLGWDGKVSDTEFIAPGGYRITLSALDEYNQTSLSVSALQRIQY